MPCHDGIVVYGDAFSVPKKVVLSILNCKHDLVILILWFTNNKKGVLSRELLSGGNCSCEQRFLMCLSENA